MTDVITNQNILIKVLKKPGLMKDLSISQWNCCLTEAKTVGLQGRLAHDAEQLGILDILPAKVQNMFKSFKYNSQSSTRKIEWEMNRVHRALRGSNEKVILMKGATYIAKKMQCSAGRISVDLDILVAKNRIDWAEEQFLKAGWKHHVINDYDQKFYREYSHELPPLVHPERHISIDVHHSILPVTSRLNPDMKKMMDDAVDLGNGFHTFSDVDIVLHSVVHLFHDGEIRSSIRNLLEQHDMYSEFGMTDGFWQKLIPRAEELGLTRPLYYSLKFTKLIFDTNIPDDVMRESRVYGSNLIADAMMNHMVPGVISPTLGARGIDRWVSMNGLYIRSHWLRMPPLLLIKHLTIKFFRSFSAEQ